MTSPLRFIIAQVVSDTTATTDNRAIYTFRATKYLKDECENYYRVSVAKMDLTQKDVSPQDVELIEDIHTADECKKLFERFQLTYIGYVKQPLKMVDFI